MGDHDVGIPLTNQTRYGAAIFECWHQLAVMNIEHLRRHSQSLRDFGRLGSSPLGQRSACHPPVANITVRDRHQLYMMPLLRPQRGSTTALVLRIVRMCAEADDVQFSIVGFFVRLGK